MATFLKPETMCERLKNQRKCISIYSGKSTLEIEIRNKNEKIHSF
jgi:hypothetical protein